MRLRVEREKQGKSGKAECRRKLVFRGPQTLQHTSALGTGTRGVLVGMWGESWKRQLDRQVQATEKRMDPSRSKITPVQLWNNTQGCWGFLDQYCPLKDSGCHLGWSASHYLGGRALKQT